MSEDERRREPPRARSARGRDIPEADEEGLRRIAGTVAVVGYPNVGKSTLIARVSAAKPKIADYPFTTLVPNLGVVALSGDRSFVMADVPGLIEGAHEGKGLGHRFLGHVERTKVLLHIVDVSEASGRDPVEELEVIRRELEQYVPNADTLDPDALPLAARPQVVAANRIDILADPSRLEALREHAASLGLTFHAISAVTGEGVPALLETLWPYVQHGIYGYNCRYIDGTTSWSTHAFGIAIDVSSAVEYQGKCTSDVNRYTKQIWQDHNWYWGLAFCDPMHFQYATDY